MSNKNSLFAKGSGVYVCRLCGKHTRQTDPDSAAIELCGLCYEVAGIENQHSDDGHKGLIRDCEICLAEMTPKARVHCLANPELFD